MARELRKLPYIKKKHIFFGIIDNIIFFYLYFFIEIKYIINYNTSMYNN